MKLASFRIDGAATWGMIVDEEAIDLGALLRGRLPDLKSAIAADALPDLPALATQAVRHPLSAVEWLPVIPNPDKILCVGLNYETHRKETGRTEVQHPTIFARYANSQLGHLQDILRPKVSTDLDFEGELAVVIGKPGRYVSRADAMGLVAGYACYNDGSVRDFQRHTHQFTPARTSRSRAASGHGW